MFRVLWLVHVELKYGVCPLQRILDATYMYVGGSDIYVCQLTYEKRSGGARQAI